MPVGKVKWYDADEGFGFLSQEDGPDVHVRSEALPDGVTALKNGTRVESASPRAARAGGRCRSGFRPPALGGQGPACRRAHSEEEARADGPDRRGPDPDSTGWARGSAAVTPRTTRPPPPSPSSCVRWLSWTESRVGAICTGALRLASIAVGAVRPPAGNRETPMAPRSSGVALTARRNALYAAPGVRRWATVAAPGGLPLPGLNRCHQARGMDALGRYGSRNLIPGAPGSRHLTATRTEVARVPTRGPVRSLARVRTPLWCSSPAMAVTSSPAVARDAEDGRLSRRSRRPSFEGTASYRCASLSSGCGPAASTSGRSANWNVSTRCASTPTCPTGWPPFHANRVGEGPEAMYTLPLLPGPNRGEGDCAVVGHRRPARRRLDRRRLPRNAA